MKFSGNISIFLMGLFVIRTSQLIDKSFRSRTPSELEERCNLLLAVAFHEMYGTEIQKSTVPKKRRPLLEKDFNPNKKTKSVIDISSDSDSAAESESAPDSVTIKIAPSYFREF